MTRERATTVPASAAPTHAGLAAAAAADNDDDDGEVYLLARSIKWLD